MVHRPADSRLLTNLLKQEKDYWNSLTTTLDLFQASLSALQAYASASAPPVSQVIVSVSNFLGGADDALRKYSVALEEWRLKLQGLKDLEDEVGNVMRDREILVNRLIKASKSKSQKDLTVMPPSPGSSFSRSTGGKLSVAQTELQACEAHLSTKEHELEVARVNVVRDGLRNRCKAMIECGWTWGEMGKEGMSALEHFQSTGPNFASNTNDINLHRASFYKPLPNPGSPEFMGSDVSSLLPSHSASQLALPPALIEPVSRRSDLDLDPPHSISDHAVPLHKEPTPISLNDDSSDEDVVPPENLEVYENQPFSIRKVQKSKERVGSRSELAPATSYSTRQKEQEKKVRKRTETTFFGGLASLFRSRKKKDDSSDDGDDDHVPEINYNSLRRRTTSFPPASPSSSPQTSMRLKKSKRNTVDGPLNLMQATRSDIGPSRSGTIKSTSTARSKPMSTLGRMESTKAPKSSLSATLQLPSSSQPVLAAPRSTSVGPGIEPQRSDTVKSDTSQRNRRSFDGSRPNRHGHSALKNGQPSLLTVVEDAGAMSRDIWGNEVRLMSTPHLQTAKAPGSVLDKVVVPFPTSSPTLSASASSMLPPTTAAGDIQPPSSANHEKMREAPQPKVVVNGGLVPANPDNLSSPPSRTSTLSRNQPAPLKSALRNRSPSPSPSPIVFARSPTESEATPRPQDITFVPSTSILIEPQAEPMGAAEADDVSDTNESDYETVQENISEDEGTEPATPQQPVPASSLPPELVPTSSLPPATPAKDNNHVTTNHRTDDLHSVSSDSTAGAGSGNGPQRRKSVRVSLQPTFAPTPPALEDGPVSPWAGSSSPNSHPARETRIEPPGDAWQDSSEDEDDYSRARQALSKAAKKLTNIGKK